MNTGGESLTIHPWEERAPETRAHIVGSSLAAVVLTVSNEQETVNHTNILLSYLSAFLCVCHLPSTQGTQQTPLDTTHTVSTHHLCCPRASSMPHKDRTNTSTA